MKSKWPQIQERLAQVEAWAREGIKEAQIAKNLGVGKTAFESYKKTHQELKDALKRGKAPFIDDLRSALVRRALGEMIKETKTYVKNEDGKMVRYQEISERYIPPSVAACAILLKNLDREGNDGRGWSDDPAGLDLRKQIAEFEKENALKKLW